MLIDKMNYEFLKDYILQINTIHCINDFKIIMEDLIHYIEYYPQCEIPEYFKRFDLTKKECKKLINLCNKRIKYINNRVVE